MRILVYDLTPQDLKAIREDVMGLSGPKWADTLGYSYDLIKSWESGRSIPSYEAQMRICEAADVAFMIRKQKKHPLYTKKVGA